MLLKLKYLHILQFLTKISIWIEEENLDVYINF